MLYDNTYVNIDMDAIEANFDAIRRKATVPVMAIIKADAYGHGAVQVARLLEPKVAFFGVSGVGEALELRQSGLEKPILILGHTPTSAYPQIVGMDIRPAISAGKMRSSSVGRPSASIPPPTSTSPWTPA